jgi:hypothetical protein
VADAFDSRLAIDRRDARDGWVPRLREEMEVVVRRVVVDLEPVRAFRQRAAVELVHVRVEQVDLLRILDNSGQDRQRSRRHTGLSGRIGLADPPDVGTAALAGRIDMPAGVLSERDEARHGDVCL